MERFPHEPRRVAIRPDHHLGRIRVRTGIHGGYHRLRRARAELDYVRDGNSDAE